MAQATFDDLGTPLSDVDFVVVDLETTGGSPADAGITEIGAVRVRHGEVIGEFQTLVDPGCHVPAFITSLTGITDAMVRSAPPLSSVLPAFLEFARGSVLVAHNAPYDVGFLRGACALHDTPWPAFTVVDTVRLARSVLPRDEVRNVKLSTLAARFSASTTPSHRALDDARATVDVLHALLERLGPLGVWSLEDLLGFSSRVPERRARKRSLADDLPDLPGVYVFEDAAGLPLYVGTSRSLRTRVRSYFTASEQRARMTDMVAAAVRVRPIVCATRLEAQVREIRLIADYQPRFNRRSRSPRRESWLKLTDEPFPRLARAREVREDGATYLGPFTRAAEADAASEALLAAIPLRTCTDRLPLAPRTTRSGCVLGDVGRCLAPCRDPSVVVRYDELARSARDAMSGRVAPVTGTLSARMRHLAADERYEEAAGWRDRLTAFTAATHRTQRLAMLARCPELVAARATDDHGWDIHVIRFGRLAASGHAPAGRDPVAVVEGLIAVAEVVDPGVAPAPAGLTEECRLILRWLETDGTRLVRLDGDHGLALAIDCGGRESGLLTEARDARVG